MNMKNELVFAPEGHIYRLADSGQIVPSVTQIIQAVFPFDAAGLVVERATNFGYAVHEGISLDLKGCLNPSTVDDAIKPYINQFWILFDSLSMLTVRAKTEIKLFHKSLHYAGRIDLVHADTLIEIKTGQKNKTHRLQASAYKHLWNSNNPKEKVKDALIAYFDGGDEVPAIVRTEASDYNVFLSCLEIWKWKQKEGIK